VTSTVASDDEPRHGMQDALPGRAGAWVAEKLVAAAVERAGRTPSGPTLHVVIGPLIVIILRRLDVALDDFAERGDLLRIPMAVAAGTRRPDGRRRSEDSASSCGPGTAGPRSTAELGGVGRRSPCRLT
jgi:hypothetical protein